MWKEASKSIFIPYLGGCGLVFAEGESRSDLVESARTQEEANLTPETSPKGEIRIASGAKVFERQLAVDDAEIVQRQHQSGSPYLAATIECAANGAVCGHAITVYLRTGATGREVVEVDR